MIGQTISHYKILEKLGQGGMGEVYKAVDFKLQRTVALKFIKTEELENERDKTRFVNEARVAAALNHPHINTIYEIDEVEDKTFIAMELVEGKSLREIVKESPLDLKKTLDIAFQIAGGLQEAHENGIVHRDIKSSNIMINDKGKAKIMDFGLAKFSEGTDVTRTAAIVGTIAYMSPEQACGEDIDARTDIWSYGVVLYEMLTGQLPFKGTQDQLALYSILHEPPFPVTRLSTGIPLELEIIIEKCLEKERERRYQSMAELYSDLKHLADDITGVEVPRRRRKLSPSFSRGLMRRILIPAAVIFLLLALLVTVTSIRESIIAKLGLKPLPKKMYLAVAPITVIGDYPELQEKCDGIVEILTNYLSQLESFQQSLAVLPSSDMSNLPSTSAVDLRKKFGVSLVLEGKMIPVGESFKLTLNLSETKTPSLIRTAALDVSPEEIPLLHKNALNTVVGMLALEIKPEVEEMLAFGETDNPDAWIYYLEGQGNLKYRQQEERIDRAIDRFRMSIEKDPDFALAYVALGEAYWEKYNITRNIVWFDEAKSFCSRAIKLNDRLSQAYTTLGYMFFGIKEYETALLHFQDAVEIDPLSPRVRNGLAITYDELGMFEDAESNYKRAIELNPDYITALNNFGLFYYYRGMLDRAEEMWQKAVDKASGNEIGHTYLGILHLRAGKIDLAIHHWEKSYEISPNAAAVSNLGYAYYVKRDYEKAKNMYEEAVKMQEKEYSKWGNLADIYRYTGDETKAVETYKIAIRMAEEELKVRKNDALLWAKLSSYYAQIGEKATAQKNIAKALEIAPQAMEVLIVSVKVFEHIDNRNLALESLNTLIEQRGSLSEIEIDPDLDSFRQDPRYLEIEKKVKGL